MPRLSIETLRLAAADAIRKLDPRVQYRNPVMAVTCVGALLTTTLTARDLIWPGSAPPGSPGAWFGALISVWLWATVLFANLAEAVAEGQGRAQAATLRKARAEAKARRITGDGMDGGEERVPASQLRKGDRVRCGPGDAIPADGEVIAGAASVDESAVTGESAPVIRESGGDRSAVTGGTRVLSDECDLPGPGGARALRKGAADAIRRHVEAAGGAIPAEVAAAVDEVAARGQTPLVVADEVAARGQTPLVVADGARAIGVVALSDVVKAGIRERFARFRLMGIRTVMITGDNPRTAAIAREAGVDDFIAEATPEMKLERIRAEQGRGHLVAMTGDGTNDAPALAQADVGVAMATGTQAAREAGNMVDLDSDPTKLLEIVEVGKQLLMTRGALTTFSIANDVAKYFAILPALFVPVFPGLAALDVMRLHSPASAILAAVVFNALIIGALIPLALRGVRWSPIPAALLQRNLLIYGLGGLIAPFVGIKLIDVLLVLTLSPLGWI